MNRLWYAMKAAISAPFRSQVEPEPTQPVDPIQEAEQAARAEDFHTWGVTR